MRKPIITFTPLFTYFGDRLQISKVTVWKTDFPHCRILISEMTQRRIFTWKWFWGHKYLTGAVTETAYSHFDLILLRWETGSLRDLCDNFQVGYRTLSAELQRSTCWDQHSTNIMNWVNEFSSQSWTPSLQALRKWLKGGPEAEASACWAIVLG